MIAAVEHGEFCLGNVVPSCQDCNDHRGKKEWRTYLLSEFADEAEKRIGRIEEYLAKYPYHITDDPHEYLTDTETVQYLSWLEEWESLWERARSLRDAIDTRRSNEET